MASGGISSSSGGRLACDERPYVMVTVGFGGAVTRELRAIHLLRKVRNCRLILVVVSSTIRSERIEGIAGRMEEKVEVADEDDVGSAR